MKHSRLPSLLALTISFELIISPLPAFAQQQQSAASSVMGALDMGLNAYNSLRGNQGSINNSYVATDMAALAKQQTAVPDKYFTVANMQKIPGLMEYIAKKNLDASKSGGKMISAASLQCNTLPTTLTETNTEVCRNKSINTISGNPAVIKAQGDEAFAYYNQYLQIDKLYQNYSSKSNQEGQAFGTGCMDDAMQVLKGFFAYRTEQLDAVMADLEAKTAAFQEQSEVDLKAIRESTAILNGPESSFGAEFKDANIFNYADRFGDPACNSIMAKDDVNTMGQEGGGLLAIEKKLKGDFNTVPEGSRYSPTTYLANNANVVSDIQKMADKVATQATLNSSSLTGNPQGFSAFLSGISNSVSSETGANVALNASFFADVQTKFAQSSKKLTDQANVLKSELGNKGSNAFDMLSNSDNDSSFEAELTTLENSIKNECVNRSGVDVALSRIWDPNLSKQANQKSAEQLRKKIKLIMDDASISADNKLAQLQALESSSGGRYEMKMDADYETKEVVNGTVVTKKVAAAGKVSPSSYFTDVIKNCETQFQVNKLNNKLSAKQTIQQMRTLKADYKKAAAQNAKDLKAEVLKKMINCNDNATVASSSAVGSCSPAVLNMSSPNFCTKAAFSCATNMKSCTEKAQKVVKDIKDDRMTRANNYNKNVEVVRKQLVGIVDTALAEYTKQAESLRGMFGAGFKAPTGIVRDVKDGSQFDAKYSSKGDSLEIKDPARYLEMVREDMKKLQESVAKQQDEIIGSDGLLQKHIDQTGNNYKTNVLAKTKSLMNECLAAYNSYNRFLADSKKAADDQKAANDKLLGELGEKSAAFCNSFNDVMVNNVTAGCDDALGETSDSMIQIAIKAGKPEVSSEASRMRADMKFYCNQPGNQKSKEGKSTATIDSICALAGNGDKNAIAALKPFISKITPSQDQTADNACLYLIGTAEQKTMLGCAVIPVEAVTNVAGQIVSKATTKVDCTPQENRVVANYNLSSDLPGSSLAVDYDPQPSAGDTGSFCAASNNSGNYNTKGGYQSKIDKMKAANASKTKQQ